MVILVLQLLVVKRDLISTKDGQHLGFKKFKCVRNINDYYMLSMWGEASSDLDETWAKFFPQASRSFLYSSGALETTRNPQTNSFLFSRQQIKTWILDLDFGFHAFGAGSREEISRRI